MNEEAKKPDAHEAEVVDRVPANAAELTQPEHGIATGEGRAHFMPMQVPLDPTDMIKRMKSYTALAKAWTEENLIRRAFAVSKTNKFHWSNLDGKPYLNKAGALCIMGNFHISEIDRKVEEKEYTDELGKFKQWECTSKFATPDGQCVIALGTKNLRSQFFTMKKEIKLDENGKAVMKKNHRTGQEYPEKVKVRRELSEIDYGSIQKSAITNALVNGIQAILALDGITWEELSQMTNGRLKADLVEQVSYGSRGADGQMGPASDGQVRMLFAKSYNAGKGCLEALCKHLGIPKLREGTKDAPGEIHVQANQVNAAVKFIESWGSSASAANGAEGKLTQDQVDRLNNGKEMLGISDADWKNKWGNLPQDMQAHLFPKADEWLNQQADN